MLCMRLRNVCDTGLMPWAGATTCASTQHQEERGMICGNSSNKSIVDGLRQASLVCEIDLHSISVYKLLYIMQLALICIDIYDLAGLCSSYSALI